MCIITFHSLEDRIVKLKFRDLADPCKCPKEFPICVCGKKPTVKLVKEKLLSQVKRKWKKIQEVEVQNLE